MNDLAFLELKNLVVGYRYGKKSRSVMSFPDIRVERGDFIAIAGENGIGKSTLIKTLVQLIPGISGDIFIQGKPITRYSRIKLATLISYVSTEIVHAQQISVKDLVTFGRYPHTNWFGKIQKEDQLIVDQAIHMLQLEHLAEKNLDEVSDGERQRAMIARALAQQTEIIILDEPTAFLDLPHKHEIINLLGKFCKEHRKTILFTTHDLSIAIKEVDKLWLLSCHGFFEGTPEDLILQGAISKTFNTPKVSFDNRKGEFAIKKTFKPYFYIGGKSAAVHWTKNAIEKDGFTVMEAADEKHPVIFIESFPGGYKWTVVLGEERNEFSDILALRRFIRHKYAPYLG